MGTLRDDKLIQWKAEPKFDIPGTKLPPTRSQTVESLESGRNPNGNFVKVLCTSLLVLVGLTILLSDARMQATMIVVGVAVCTIMLIAETIARYFKYSIVNRIDTRIIRRSYYRKLSVQEELNYKREVAAYLKRIDWNKPSSD